MVDVADELITEPLFRINCGVMMLMLLSLLKVTELPIVVLAFVVWMVTAPPVRLRVVIPVPGDLAKSTGRSERGVGGVPGGDPIGNGMAGPTKMEPPPVDIVAEAPSGKLIVSPVGRLLKIEIAVPNARLEKIEESAPKVSSPEFIRTPSVPET